MRTKRRMGWTKNNLKMCSTWDTFKSTWETACTRREGQKATPVVTLFLQSVLLAPMHQAQGGRYTVLAPSTRGGRVHWGKGKVEHLWMPFLVTYLDCWNSVCGWLKAMLPTWCTLIGFRFEWRTVKRGPVEWV